jgi:myo-inositol-1(or 4)-monophosphatase
MHHYLNIAIKAARSAGKIITRHLDSVETLKVFERGPHNLTTAVDKAAEEEMIAIIRQAYPHHAILGEETGHTGGEECTWILDPINGTANFIHGYPQFALSIAVKQKDQIEHGVIYDPISQELFAATRGAGVQVNGRRLRISKQDELNNALIATAHLNRQDSHSLDAYLHTFKQVCLSGADIRRTGSPALDLAYLAAGRLDGYWQSGLQPWDIAAGALMVREAGGYAGDFNNEDRFLENGNLVAGTRKVYVNLLHIIQQK